MTKKMTKKTTKGPNLKHTCDWRKAAIKLARCVVMVLQTDGKIGVGSGLVMRTEGKKKVLERWDKDFIEALAFIGIEVVDKPKASKRKPPNAARLHETGA